MPKPAILASLGLPTVSAGPAPPPPLLCASSQTGVGATTRPSASIARPVTPGFSLGHGFPLIPSKLVFKFEQFEFFNMAELLPDNIELCRKTEAISAPSTCLPKVPKKREFSHDSRCLLAWVICFSTYAAVASKKHPNMVQQLWAYQATIVREALHFDCRGWIGYDMFRQQVAKNHNTDWSTPVCMFYSRTFLSQRVESVTCFKCMSPDHTERDCALNSRLMSYSPPNFRPQSLGEKVPLDPLQGERREM